MSETRERGRYGGHSRRGLKLAVDPLAAVHYWEPINAVYKLDIAVVNPKVDPTFSFMTVDHDGKIRMDCSSPYAMASLVSLKDRYRLAFANDPDSDRHGIVTPSAGLMNPNHVVPATAGVPIVCARFCRDAVRSDHATIPYWTAFLVSPTWAAIIASTQDDSDESPVVRAVETWLIANSQDLIPG
jgi:hypothetical protein